MTTGIKIVCVVCLLGLFAVGQAQNPDSLKVDPPISIYNQGHVFSLPQAIQGQMPGLMVSRPGANPNGAYDMIYRGYNTYTGRTQPLLMLDGMPGLPWQFADPFLFDSLHVWQGASAVRMGLQAGAGVFEASLRQPQKQGLSVQLMQNVTIENLQRPYETLSGPAFRANAPVGSIIGDANTDWLDLLTTSAWSSHTGVRIAYQQDRLKSRAVLSRRSVNAIQPGSGFDQLTMYGGVDYAVWEDKITMGGSALLVNRDASLGNAMLFEGAVAMNPTIGATEDLTFFTSFGGNPYLSLQQNTRNLEANVRMLQAYVKVNPLPDWQVSAKVGEMQTELFQNQRLGYPQFFANEATYERYDERLDGRKFFELYTNYTLQSDRLKLIPQISYTSQQINYGTDGFFGYTFLQPGMMPETGTVDDVETGTYALGAWAFSLQAAIQDRAELSVIFQSEESTNLGSDAGRGNFFGMDVRYLLKPRWHVLGSYTHTGLIPHRSGLSQTQVQISQQPAFARQLHISNPQLKWEDTRQWELGTGGTWLNGKLSGEVRFFVRTSSDFIQELEAFDWAFSVYNRFYPRSFQNFGEVRNRGMEWTLALNGVTFGEFAYRSGLQASFMKSEWRNLDAQFTSLEGRIVSPSRMPGGGWFLFMHRLATGEPIGTMNAPTFVGINQATGEWILDTPNSPFVNSLENYVPQGQGVPRWHTGWNHQLSWRKWRFDMMLRGVFGHSNFNETSFRYGTAQLTNANRISASESLRRAGLQDFNVYNSYFIEPSGFLSLHYASIARDLEVGVGNRVLKGTISLIGNNLFFLTKYSGADPEARLKTYAPWREFDLANPSSYYFAPGIDAANTWLPGRAFTLALSVNF